MNKVTLAGRLTMDPEKRMQGKGDDAFAIVNFSIAVDDINDHVDFFRCSAVGRTAEIIDEYLRKGDQIIIDGSIYTSKYQPEWANKEVTTYDIRIDRFDFGAKSRGLTEETEQSSRSSRSNRRGGRR